MNGTSELDFLNFADSVPAIENLFTMCNRQFLHLFRCEVFQSCLNDETMHPYSRQSIKNI
jgi:hypothetical protein